MTSPAPTPATTTTPAATPRRAVVIGASIAGLLAARVLAEHYTQVVLLDRDELPPEPTARPGVPHGRQVHGLLARGREVIEELLPGLTEQLVTRGALLGDFQSQARFYVDGHPLAAGTSGLLALAVSRPLLEWQVRQQVAALPNVQIRDRTSVLDLDCAPDSAPGAMRVTGVRLTRPDHPGPSTVLAADLVLDASGRTSRTPEQLQRRGYLAPPEEHVRIDVCYATRQFRRRPEHLSGQVALIEPVGSAIPRAGLLLAQEGDRWVAGLTGYHGDRPPTDLPGFLAYADSCPGPLGATLRGLDPIDDGHTYRFPANVRRRYERLTSFPEGLLVTGDALCAFDPAYGQGMTVAALEALELRTCLRAGRHQLAPRFFRRAATHIDTPWTLVVGRDRELPGATDPAPLATRLLNRYLRAVMTAAVHDPDLARTFLRVSHLTAPPSTLFTPRVIAGTAAAILSRTGAAPANQPASAAAAPPA
ncbi:hypothetical protein [Intrasporangium sp.]|uniref:FAD-dependent oxidoreductase n=1 Tax=Intrasporangium sp. TaxID=1925024 RepID=UPI0032215105